MSIGIRRLLGMTFLSCCIACASRGIPSGDGQDDQSSRALSYSASEVREDLAYLYETLQATTYDLYLNTPRSVFDEEFERMRDSITQSMSHLQAHRLFQQFVSLARFSHCTLEFPSDVYQRWYRNGGHWFPFDITLAGGSALVTTNWSSNRDIEPGDEIVAINGASMEQILQELFTYISGENAYAKQAQLETGSLLDSYWYAFGEYRTGTVRIRKPGGQIVDLVVDGIDLKEYSSKAESVTPVEFIRGGRDFHFIGDIAYLRPGVFLNETSTDISKHEAFENTEFLDFLTSAFSEIAAERSQVLILDLRGNNGGDNSFSDPMIAYFADHPFQIASSYRVRTSRITKEFWRDLDIPSLSEMKNQIMTSEDGARFDVELTQTVPREDGLKFKGRVVTLIDRFSYSNAAVVAAIIQDYGFGYLVGEETSYVPSSCAAVHTFTLPHTNIGVIYPKACSIRPSGDPVMRGVIPDQVVSDDIFTEADEVLESALKAIRNENAG
jgi:C-terminal processing protease CtpA/Prc